MGEDMKVRLVLLIGLAILSCALLAAEQTASNNPPWSFGVGGSFGAGTLYETDKAFETWDSMPYMDFGFMYKVRLLPGFEAGVDASYCIFNSKTNYFHPYPYVFEMDSNVKTRSLRIPVSMIAVWQRPHYVPSLYLGGGIFMEFPIEAKNKTVLVYNYHKIPVTYNIIDDMPSVMHGFHVVLGSRIDNNEVEIKYTQSLSGYNLSSYPTDALNHGTLSISIKLWLVGSMLRK